MSTVPPHVPVPKDDELAHEPARTIGDLFKNKAMIRTILVGLASGLTALGLKVGPTELDQWTEFVFAIGTLATLAVAQYEARKRAGDQAEETRRVVYAPASVAALVDEAARPTVDLTTHASDGPITPL